MSFLKSVALSSSSSWVTQLTLFSWAVSHSVTSLPPLKILRSQRNHHSLITQSEITGFKQFTSCAVLSWTTHSRLELMLKRRLSESELTVRLCELFTSCEEGWWMLVPSQKTSNTRVWRLYLRLNTARLFVALSEVQLTQNETRLLCRMIKSATFHSLNTFLSLIS